MKSPSPAATEQQGLTARKRKTSDFAGISTDSTMWTSHHEILFPKELAENK